MADQVSASHILLMYKGSQGSAAKRTKEEAMEQIKMVQAEIANGVDFADLAQEHSECPSSEDGGDLGSFGRGAMVPEFDEAVFELEVDGVSDVVETAFGYHLIHRTA